MLREQKIAFLMTRLDVAETHLDVARSLSREEDRARRAAEAWKAYDSVVESAAPLGLEGRELSVMMNRLRVLRRRLIETKRLWK